jgi:hypothetical protein
MIEKSSILAGDRRQDVFTGIDIFGRGCVGGFNTYQSLEIIEKYKTSVALYTFIF